MSEDRPSIDFPAEVTKVTTMTSGAIRVQLDLPEQMIEQAAMLMQCKKDGIYLQIKATAHD